MTKRLKPSKKCKEALKKNRAKLHKKKNVVGAGIGRKRTNGETTDEESIVVLVQKKVDIKTLAFQHRVPKKIDGIPTDVIEVGHIKAQHQNKIRPVTGGISCGHTAITAGTLGALVRIKGDNKVYGLSNNHVIANSNNSSIGDVVIQPGPYDGGMAFTDDIGRLSHVVPIDFSGSNKVDAALFLVDEEALMDDDSAFVEHVIAAEAQSQNIFMLIWDAIVKFFAALFGMAPPLPDPDPEPEPEPDPSIDDSPINLDQYGSVQGIFPTVSSLNLVGDPLIKSGRTTGVTTGEIIALDVSVDVDYGDNGVARFDGQILADAMSSGGDSGSVVLNTETSEIVGLLFAGSDLTTVLNPMKDVVEAFNLNIS